MKRLKDFALMTAIFAVISLLFCLPQLKGKRLYQEDNFQWKCMAHEAMAYHDSTGKDVLWSNNMYGGMPTYTTYIGTANRNFAANFQSLFQLLGKPAYFFFIAMLCFYLLMRVLDINKWVAALGAFAYAFATYNVIIIVAGHETQSLTLGYLPAALAGLLLIYQKHWLYGASLFGVAIALMVTNNHYQMMFYALVIFIAFGIAMLVVAIRERKFKHFAIALLVALGAGLIGLGPGFTSLLTTKEYSRATIRGGKSTLSIHDKKRQGGLDKDDAFAWSGGIMETFCIMIPYLYGGSSNEPIEHAPEAETFANKNTTNAPLYWGGQPVLLGPNYLGAIVCFLFVLGLLVVPSVHKWWILCVSVLGFILSLGSNLAIVNYFLFDNFPFLNMFRAVTMAKVIPQLLFPVLAAWALHIILTKQYDTTAMLRKIFIAAGITAGISLVFSIAGTSFLSFTAAGDSKFPAEVANALRDDRIALAKMSGFKSALYILLATGLIWAFIKNKIREQQLVLGIGLLLVIDIIPIDLNYLNDNNYIDPSDYDAKFEPRDVDKQILKDKDPYYRVLDLTKNPFSNAFPSYFHKCVGGYCPAIMEKYNDLIESQMLGGFNLQILNMLNTKYVIAVDGNKPPYVTPNDNACGNAWFVSELKWAATDEESMGALKAPKIGDTTKMPNAFEPKKTAVILTKFKKVIGDYTFGKDSSAYVKLDKYGLDEISYVSSNTQNGLAVFSDIYYSKGWSAYVDGKITPIVKADYVLRAVKIPAGKHKIEFRFEPETFYMGQMISLSSSIGLLLLCCGSAFLYFKNFKKELTP